MSRPIRALLLVAGATVLVVLVRRIGVASVADLLRRVGWGFVAVSVVYAAHLGVRAAALWRCLPRREPADGPPAAVSYADVLRVRLSGEAVEMLTLTGPFLAEPAKGWLLARRGLTGANAFGAVAIEYLLYTVTSAWLATVALLVLVARGVLPAALHQPVVGIIAGMIAFTIACVVAAVTGVGLIVPIVRGFGVVIGSRAEALASRIDPVERVLIAFMHQHPARLAGVLAIEAVGQALLVSEIWIVVRTLAFPFSAADPFIVEGAVKFITIAFFFVPGQLGASESIYTLLFESLGLPGAVGLTMALVRRVRGTIVAGAGLIVVVMTRVTESDRDVTRGSRV